MSRQVEFRDGDGTHPPLRIERSTRRRKTASAFVRDGYLVVQLPAAMRAREQERTIAALVDKVTGQQRARRFGGDEALAERAAELADRYLDGIRPASIRFVSNMRSRWGSCTPSTGDIRISTEVAAFPEYARDAVIVHELAHLLEPNHSARFHELVGRYPEAERAAGFLAGVRFAQSSSGAS